MPDRKCWLFKSELTAYSFADLMAEQDRTAEWDGVRNYQVRNYMRDEMKVGDRVLFYHSSSNPLAVVGTATIVKEAYPDNTAWEPSEKHYDAKSTPDNPIWLMVDIRGGPGILQAGCPTGDQKQPPIGEYVAGEKGDAPFHPAGYRGRMGRSGIHGKRSLTAI